MTRRTQPQLLDVESQRKSAEQRQSGVLLEVAKTTDIPEIADCAISAYADDLFTHAWNRYVPEKRDEVIEFLRGFMKQPNFWGWVARDAETGGLLGYALWYVMHTVTDHSLDVMSVYGVSARDTVQSGSSTGVPQSDLDRLKRDHVKRVLARQEVYVGGKKHLYLGDIAVYPHTQGRGVGSQLIQQGLDRADRDGDACYLNATPAGYPLYLHHSFFEVEKIDVDLNDWYGPNKGYGLWVGYLMIRLPRIIK